ncbi:HAMP domain-containing sensor histidine kinase [Blautia sp. HCP3S3_D9]|uniref:HAMP domain-containing sensor histidine kinase n=1 Tax=Blautia sp. HCP3S3_D9 TaxID=3438912 RepID=UPI003F8ACC07
MDKIKNLSVRKTILLYLAVGLICSFLLSAVVVKIATYTQEQIWWNYVDQDKYFEVVNEEERGKPYYRAEIPRPSSSDMSSADRSISEFCDFLQTYVALILSATASCASVFLFYKHKLKQPIEELEQASKRIAGNDLDFHITYENQDEMGRLCGEFERMREQLAQNNQELWRMVEEERALRAAIAHDIRSPLSVLKGYQEMLMDYLPDGTVDTKTAMEMLSESWKQIQRMDHFVETMRKMSSLEQRTLLSCPITAEEMKADIMAELVVLEAKKEKQVILKLKEATDVFQGDKEVILEVTENLPSNALRYAKAQIIVNVFVTQQELKISVEDDGSGFDSDMEMVTKAFYQQNVKDSLNHAGMGMYISRLYCEKHGGRLVLENRTTGGAVVTAIFRRIV